MLTKLRNTILEVSCWKLENRFSSPTVFFLFLLIFNLVPFISYSQCAMCRAAVESEGNGVKAEAINDGIVYLMVIPYLLVGAIGYAVYRMYRNKKQK